MFVVESQIFVFGNLSSKHYEALIHQSKKMIQPLTDCMEQILNRLVKDFAQFIFDLRKCINKNAIKSLGRIKHLHLVCSVTMVLYQKNSYVYQRLQFPMEKRTSILFLKRVVIFPVKSIGILPLQDILPLHCKAIISYTRVCISCVSWLLK